MNTLYKRFLLFLIGCIGTRLLLVHIAKTSTIDVLRYMGYIALLPAFGFIQIYLTDTRKTGPEVFGDVIWWDALRPIHSLLYLLFALNAINGNKDAWIYLMIDVTLGLVSFLTYHMYLK